MTEFKPSEIMLQNYIQNKLSPKDTEQLELWLADHPEVMQELEMDIMLSQADFDPNEQTETAKKASFSFLDFFASKKLVPINVLAYGLALFFVFNTLINTKTSSNYSSATFIELEKQRSAEPETIEVQTVNNKSLVIRFFPDSNNDAYKVVLKSPGSKQEMVFEDLKADKLDSITVMLESNYLKNNKWQVKIYNSENQLEQVYEININ